MKLVKIQATSHQAGILERRVGNKDKFRWLGSTVFEKVQLIKTIDPKLCDPMPVIMIEDYKWEAADDDPNVELLEEEAIDLTLPKGFAPLHIFIDDEYSFSTTRFETKVEASKYYREQPEYKGLKLRCRLNNYTFTRLKIKTHLEK